MDEVEVPSFWTWLYYPFLFSVTKIHDSHATHFKCEKVSPSLNCHACLRAIFLDNAKYQKLLLENPLLIKMLLTSVLNEDAHW